MLGRRNRRHRSKYPGPGYEVEHLLRSISRGFLPVSTVKRWSVLGTGDMGFQSLGGESYSRDVALTLRSAAMRRVRFHTARLRGLVGFDQETWA